MRPRSAIVHPEAIVPRGGIVLPDPVGIRMRPAQNALLVRNARRVEQGHLEGQRVRVS